MDSIDLNPEKTVTFGWKKINMVDQCIVERYLAQNHEQRKPSSASNRIRRGNYWSIHQIEGAGSQARWNQWSNKNSQKRLKRIYSK